MSPHPSRIPWLLRGLAIAGAVVMSLSLFLGFLDQLVTGTWSGTIGVDFFGVPRPGSICSTERAFIAACPTRRVSPQRGRRFRPLCRWYPYHPLLAVVVGSWTAMLRPVASYLAFVFVSFVLLVAQRGAGRPARGRRNGQGLGVFRGLRRAADLFPAVEREMHVFTVLAAAGVLAGLVDATSARQGIGDWGLGIGGGEKGTEAERGLVQFVRSARRAVSANWTCPLSASPFSVSSARRSWWRPGC